MSICLHRSGSLVRHSLLPVVQQVVHYNDKYVAKKKVRKEHINTMRKTQILKKMLKDIEPTSHDEMLEEALRFSEAEFRAQLLHLREEWSKMYSTTENTAARVERAARYTELEEERWEFVGRIEKEQEEKRAQKIPLSHAGSDSVSLEEEYRRTQLTSPDIEVEEFTRHQHNFLTPQNFDTAIEELLSQDHIPYQDGVFVSKPQEAVLPYTNHGIEFVLER